MPDKNGNDGSQGRSPKVLFDTNMTSPCEPVSNRDNRPRVLFDREEIVKNAGAALFEDSIARQRIDVTIEKLQQIDPTVKERSVLNNALTIVITTNLDDGDDMKMIYWGTDLQKRHSSLLEAEFSISQDGAVVTAQDELHKVVDILKEMNPVKALSPGWSLFNSMESLKQKMAKELSTKYYTLQSIISLLKDQLPKLVELNKKLQTHSVKLKSLAEDVNSYLLAGKFISSYISAGQHPNKDSLEKLKAQLPTLEKRLFGLTSTHGALIVNLNQKELASSIFNDLIESIQDTLLIDIPLWYTNYMGYVTLESDKTTDFALQKQQLIEQQQKILNKLNKYDNI